MSDRFPPDSDQDETPLAPDLARLHTLLLREGERWRHDEPSTARLERHVQALAQRGTAARHNGHAYTHDRDDSMLADRNPVHQLPAPHDVPARRGARSRWRGLLPAAAAVLLVALAGAIFALFGPGHAGPGRATTHLATATATPAITRVTAVRPAQTRLPLPANGYLSGISFSSAHDGWAVGGLDGPASAGRHTVMIHFHDGVWTASSDTIPNASLYDVSMDSADDGWAVGTTTDPQSRMIGGGTDFLLHYTSGHWQRVDPPALQPAGFLEAGTIRAFRMLSPDFGYLAAFVDMAGPDSNTVDTRLLLLAYQHGTWTSIPNTIEANGSAAMVSPSEGWVTSETADGTSVFYHYLNGVWTKTATYPGLLYTMQVVAPRDIWAAGVTCVTKTQCQPAVYHFDGVSWAPVPAPVVAGLDWTNLGWVALTADTAGDMWYSVIDSGLTRQYDFLAYSHGAWSSIDLPVNDYGVLALTTDGNGGTWAIVHGSAPQFDVTVLYSSGTTWSVYGHS